MAWREQLRKGLLNGGSALELAWRHLVCRLLNLRRRFLRRLLPDYPILVLDQPLSERAPTFPWWLAYVPGLRRPLSLEAIAEALERIAQDPDIRGVLFLVKGAHLTLAQAQSMAALFSRFRTWSMAVRPDGSVPAQVVVYLEQMDAASYVMASAADRVIAPPLATWDVLGLLVAPSFWKESLARIGLAFDVVRVAPWKSAMDMFSQAEMSREDREQLNWLLDSLYADIVQAIAQGRGMPPEEVQAQIDRAPLTAPQAQAAGLLDHVAYEDELPALLGTAEQPARLQLYVRCRGLLYRRPQRRHPQAVGVLSLQGLIVPGESRRFPLPVPILGEQTMGSTTVQQMVRAARQDRRLAAVVVHVDSRGGSALASDLIWRELTLLAEEKPVVIYMGNVAASGGYYIATPGHRIVAQSATLTGSIGVVVAKPVTQGAFERLHARREVIRRGANADLYRDTAPWTPDQRQKLTEQVFYVYDQFKERVASGRKLDLAGLDEIASGKVWTGRQALERGLVDELGDFGRAVELACQAAGLPVDGTVRTVPVTPPRRWLLATPAEAARTLLRLVGEPGRVWRSLLALEGPPGPATQEHLWLLALNVPASPAG
ncbi:signal peptide peptidase SppA [Litorilinea aerophila]|nr:signal peptide peptidase SppA [Litorilinea aerophila]MCC9077076.1 signal peptide peptidase SppA [Litorilinea aerophila]